MDIETITKLIDAGYTKAEIEKLTDSAGDTGGAPGNEATEPATKTAEIAGKEQSNDDTKNAEQIAMPVEISAAIEALTNTVAGLKETVKAIQTANANGAQTDTAKSDSKISDAMQSFINSL